ncbi:MAG: NAD-dependent epimerase/dehydratase family protein [Patescibacteria group bacterium]|nr:NAD-dependent epimerase/dehydratase family protein [Patescibacteria group bacterium]
MKILVTGGAGFIGSHIVDKLIEDTNEVIIIDNLSTGKKENLNSKAKFYQADIKNYEEIEKVFEQEKPEYICHQAAHASVPESVKDPISDAENNILGSINIFKLASKYNVKKIVFASTGGALYGDADVLPTPETYEAKPVSPYGVSKLAAEEYLYCFNFLNKLNYTILRYANVYGPKQDPFGEAGVVAIFCQKIANNDQPIINGDGKCTRDYVYVKDIANANLSALKSEKSQNIYNVGTGIQTDVNTIFQNLIKISGRNIPEKHGPARIGDQRTSAIDSSKIKQELNWEPKVKLEDGLKETYEWFKNK